MMIRLSHPWPRRIRLPQACAALALLACAGVPSSWAQDVPPSAPPQPAEEPAQPPAAPAEQPVADKNAGKAQAEKLDEITVQGHRDVLGDSDKRLKALQNSLPCNGCDVKPRKKKFMRKVLDAVSERVLPTEAPDHSHYDPNDKTLEFSQQGQCIGVNVNQCIPANANP
ncbi:MAG TPA: hypothetical protein VNX47_11800 [Nevskia sp.]|jgi:hypothetical protein|nr:hypothetical protein [Nevskia sp.]